MFRKGHDPVDNLLKSVTATDKKLRCMERLMRLRRLLCCIGFHDWGLWKVERSGPILSSGGSPVGAYRLQTRVCGCCAKSQMHIDRCRL